MRTSTFGRSLGVLTGALVLTTATAAPGLAATPREGQYAQYTDGGSMLVISFDVAGDGKVTPSYYNDCARVPIQYTFKPKANGKFKVTGTRTDVIGDDIQVSLTGKFKTKNLVVGKVRYTTDDCDAPVQRFRATYQGDAG